MAHAKMGHSLESDTLAGPNLSRYQELNGKHWRIRMQGEIS